MDWITSHSGQADLLHGSSTALGVLQAFQGNKGMSKAYKTAGKNTKKALAFENGQYAARGKEAFASSQREALAEKKMATLAISKAKAVAAASGGAATDPSVSQIIKNLGEEGEYNAMSALYGGQAAQAEYGNEASANEFMAKQEAAGYKYKSKIYGKNVWDDVIGTLLDGSTSFVEKYG